LERELCVFLSLAFEYVLAGIFERV
jgi:hypothetical protein